MRCEICCGPMGPPVPIYHPSLRCLLATCKNCGTGRSIFPEGYGETHYDEGYYAYDIHRPKWKQRLKMALWKVPGANRLLPIIPPKKSGKVLDVGCGYGLFLNLMQEAGWGTYGTEISLKAIEFAQKRHRVCFAPDAQFPNEIFDWITMDNVLEHIAEPRALLQQVRPWLKPEGVLSICVPNFGGIDSKFWGPHWYALMPPHHEFHYTSQGLKRLLSDCGFDCELTFQMSFESRLSAAYRGSNGGRRTLQAMKFFHLATAPRISDKYGYFITAHATRDALESNRREHEDVVLSDRSCR